ncbi:hypothetical protein SCHPADRAFT_944104 [Schizopora paradoxa]|uniref:C2H2-type domain-containing protein n=1 Tax=Schizopora paradoxa TaxID=27342 RepID=A0A0H2RVM2_9AGAM|nr:hypothetical protein SCHPADRAFT_944104 [Schizopora paradoxa]
MNSDLDYAFIEWCLSLPFDVLWSAVMEWERMLGYRGHTGTLGGPLVSETKADNEGDEESFGVLPTLPHETTGFTATPTAPLPQTTLFQHQQHIGHWNSIHDSNDIQFDDSVDDATVTRDGQFDDFAVAEDAHGLQVTASSSTSGPPNYISETARDNEGFLDPNVVLPVAHRAIGPSNASFNVHTERFSQSPTPSSSRSNSVGPSRPPSAAPTFSNGNPSGRNDGFSLSPTPPLTRSGSVVSTRSRMLITPSPTTTPHPPNGHCQPHIHGNNAHMMGPPWGSVAGPSTHPKYHQAQLELSYGHFPIAPPYTPGGVGIGHQPMPQWQQGNSQRVLLAPVLGQYNAQLHHVGQGSVPVQRNVYTQQTPAMLQRAQAQQPATRRTSTKGKTKSSSPSVQRSSAQTTSRTDAIGEPTSTNIRVLCPDCGKTYASRPLMNRHHKAKHQLITHFCVNPSCDYSTSAIKKSGIPRLDSLRRHVESKCVKWLAEFNSIYPPQKDKKQSL